MKKRIFKTMSILFLLVLIFVVYDFIIAKAHFYIPCFFHKITGFYCPGCGITRCLVSLMHFQFMEAFHYNSLVFVLVPFVFCYIVYRIYYYILGKKDVFTKRIPNYVWWILVGITLLFGILRNIPYFSFLAPLSV